MNAPFRGHSLATGILFLLTSALPFFMISPAHSETATTEQNDSLELRAADPAKPQTPGNSTIKAEKDVGLVIQEGDGAKLILGSTPKKDEVRDFDQRLMMSKRTDNPKMGALGFKINIDF